MDYMDRLTRSRCRSQLLMQCLPALARYPPATPLTSASGAAAPTGGNPSIEELHNDSSPRSHTGLYKRSLTRHKPRHIRLNKPMLQNNWCHIWLNKCNAILHKPHRTRLNKHNFMRRHTHTTHCSANTARKTRGHLWSNDSAIYHTCIFLSMFDEPPLASQV